MGTKERREREKRRLREQILAAARELFAEHGYEKVTMREVEPLGDHLGAQ